jgi:hypothetical protein
MLAWLSMLPRPFGKTSLSSPFGQASLHSRNVFASMYYLCTGSGLAASGRDVEGRPQSALAASAGVVTETGCERIAW